MRTLVSKLEEKRAKNEEGFTLIELLVVVVIIGVLIAIAIPVYLNYRKSANDAAAESDVRNAISVYEVCNSSTGSYPVQTTGAAASATPCTNQSIKTSSGTSLLYVSAAAGASYVVVGSNSGGTPTYYCYNSASGGSVKALGAAPTTPITTSTC